MIQISNVSLTFGAQEIFDNISFNINDRERIGMVGRNGSGKSTLFKMLLNQLEADEGDIIFPNHYSIGHVEQHLKFTQDTILEEGCLGLKPDEQHEEWKVEKILTGLGFSQDDLYRHPSEFSGGYQVRLNLTKALVAEPNLLLLDEPTNYLDIVSIRWLTTFLRQWENELIIITHDRNVMDTITTHSMAIHRNQVKKIEGNTEKLYDQIAIEEEVYERSRVNEAKKRKETEQFIERFRAKATLAKMVQSRVKALDRQGKKEQLAQIQNLVFKFKEADFKTKIMMQIEALDFGYNPGQKLIEDLSLEIEKGDRICIIGKNGKGKSTLLKLLTGDLEPDSGKLRINPNCHLGYFGQTNIERLTAANTVEEELTKTRDDLSRGEIRAICGAMMFSGDSALKKISILSGGEKSRVSLGKILLSPTNLLLLDEPTNHLDMESCDSLIAAIDCFSGAAIIVTHNELFLHHLATKLIVFNNNEVTVFNGSYQDFLDNVGWEDEPSAASKKVKGTHKQSRQYKKMRATLQSEYKKKEHPFKELVSELEKKIQEAEKEIEKNNKALADASAIGDSEAIRDLQIINSQQESMVEENFLKMADAESALKKIADEFKEAVEEI